MDNQTVDDTMLIFNDELSARVDKVFDEMKISRIT